MTEAPTVFELLGGVDGVRRLVDRFYDHMETRADARGIRAMHPADLSTSRDKLWWFLVGWTGGPPMYVERRGHPRLRARHLPFPIGPAERDAWLGCMDAAMDDLQVPPAAREVVGPALARLADHMRNDAG